MRLLPLFTGAIVLTLAISPGLPAFSQSTTPMSPHQDSQKRPPNFLNLSPEQQAQIEEIHQNTRSQLDTILTADQRAQLQREAPPPEGRQGMGRPPFDSLNLTAEQRSQLEAVFRSTKEQLDAVLTPEQRQQVQQHQQQHQQGS